VRVEKYADQLINKFGLNKAAEDISKEFNELSQQEQ
jgi:hypothetical protein